MTSKLEQKMNQQCVKMLYVMCGEFECSNSYTNAVVASAYVNRNSMITVYKSIVA